MAGSVINSLADASYRSLDAYPTTFYNDGSNGLAKVANNTRAGGSNPSTNGSNSNNSNFDYGSAGVQTQENAIKDASSKVKDQVLSQEDFLKLLTTQLQAQDPTKPADNNQLVTQMSQLSMVESLNSINTNMDNVLSQVGTTAAMNATNLIGTYVYTDQNKAYYGGSASSPAIWAVDAGENTYSNVKLTIKDAVTGEVVYKDEANSLTGEIKYGWPGIFSPDGPVKPEAKPDGNGSDTSTDGSTTPNTDNGTKIAENAIAGEGGDANGGAGGAGGSGSSGSGSGNGNGNGNGNSGNGDSKPDADGEENKYTFCNSGRYVIEVTGVDSSGKTVSIPVKALGFVSSVSLGKTLSDTKLNLNGMGEIPFDKANRVTL